MLTTTIEEQFRLTDFAIEDFNNHKDLHRQLEAAFLIGKLVGLIMSLGIIDPEKARIYRELYNNLNVMLVKNWEEGRSDSMFLTNEGREKV